MFMKAANGSTVINRLPPANTGALQVVMSCDVSIFSLSLPYLYICIVGRR